MLSEEAAVANAEYTYYASPNSLVYNNATYLEDLDEDTIAVLYPELGNFAEQYNKSKRTITTRLASHPSL